MERMISAPACWFVRDMVGSCGTMGCLKTMELLESVRSDVPFAEVAMIEGYGFRLKAFERLADFATFHGIERIDLDDVAWYFGGSFHIDIMSEFAGHAGLARKLGEAAGLVTHTLLPLNERGEYENVGKKLRFENAYWVNPDSPGTPFFHLGLIVRAKVSTETVSRILTEQANSEVFVGYIRELPDTIRIPDEYYQALDRTANK